MPAIVRPVRNDDLDQLEGLIAGVDRGMLTMPSTREQMAARVAESLSAFGRPSAPPDGEIYFLVLEEDGQLLGTASLITSLGKERPFYSYRISRDSKVSPELGVKVELDILHLVNDYHGDTELGTLFLRRDARGGGRGKLLSYARLFLIAADPLRFGHRAMAEVRGWTDEAGRSPFWDAVGAKFFRVDYQKADVMSARDHRFIADLMPRYPIYADLLPAEAREVIGKPHPDAAPARRMLESQRFRFNNVVDIFDAGPCMEAYVDDLLIVRRSLRMSAAEFVKQEPQSDGFVAVADMDRFAATAFSKSDDRSAVIARLGAAGADALLVFAEERK